MNFINLHIDIISLFLDFISFIFLGIIAFLTLRFTAKPKLKIFLDGFEKIQGQYWFPSDKIASHIFCLKNVGHLYAKPAIINLTLYINYEPAFELIGVKYGSILELENSEVRRGKNNSKYLSVTGIKLYHKEPSEKVIVNVKMPKQSGIYICWISARMNEYDLGVHNFKIKVL